MRRVQGQPLPADEPTERQLGSFGETSPSGRRIRMGRPGFLRREIESSGRNEDELGQTKSGWGRA